MKLFLILISLNAWSLTLDQAFERLQENEAWRLPVEDIKLKKNALKTLKSGIFPDLSLEGSYTRRDSSTSFTSRDAESLTLELSQPIFQGMKEWKAISLGKSEIKSQRLMSKSIHRELKQDLVDRFFNFLIAQKTLDLNQELIDLSQKREKDLKQRVKIGKSRRSDLLSAQAQTLNVRTLRYDLEMEKQLAYLKLRRLISLKRSETPLKQPQSKNNYTQFQKLKREYPGIVLIQLLLDQAKKNISLAKSDYYPSLDLDGTYYLHQKGNFNQRDWEASLSLSFPLYSGGETQAQVREAVINWRKTKLEAKRIQQDFYEKIDSMAQSLTLSSTKLKSLQKATKVNYKNYQELRKEYNLGLSTNLDVLQGLNKYIEEKIDLAKTELAIQSLNYQLLALAKNYENN